MRQLSRRGEAPSVLNSWLIRRVVCAGSGFNQEFRLNCRIDTARRYKELLQGGANISKSEYGVVSG
jgi:hypothetical protein